MKQKFNTTWKSSKQPRKQRKYIANAPLHILRKTLVSNLSKELRKKHGTRNIPVKKGDKVKVLRGKFKGKKGAINEVDYKKRKVKIDGVQIKKQDGSNVNAPINPSNIQITELNLEDQKRSKKINIPKTENKTKEKTQEKTTKNQDKEKSSKETKTATKKESEKKNTKENKNIKKSTQEDKK